MMFLALMNVATAACPDITESLELATSALIEGTDTTPALSEAEVRLACTKVDGPLLARLWLVRGAAKLLAGDAAGAEPFFAAAVVNSPSTFDERLGPDVRKAWESAKLQGPGRIFVDQPVLLDGKRIKRFPHVTDSGPHAVQGVDIDWAKVVVVAPNEELTVTVPLPTKAAPEAAKKSPALLIVAGTSLAGAGGLAYAATTQTDAMSQASDVAALEQAQQTQAVFAWSALGLAAVAATTATLHFVF